MPTRNRGAGTTCAPDNPSWTAHGRYRRPVGFLLRGRWLVLHGLVAAACVGMAFLGRWQWHVASAHHGLRNYAYAVQWWLFVAFAVAFWARIVHDAREARTAGRAGGDDQSARDQVSGSDCSSPEPVQFQPYVMPQAASIRVEDPALAAYNAYLAGITLPAHMRVVHARSAPAGTGPPAGDPATARLKGGGSRSNGTTPASERPARVPTGPALASHRPPIAFDRNTTKGDR